MIGPIRGSKQTPNEILKFINDRNIILLVKPEPIIKGKDGFYYDWASDEFITRRKASVAIWIICVASLAVWASKRKKEITR